MKSKPVFVKHVACPSCGVLTRCDRVATGQRMTWWCSNKQCGKQYTWVELEDGTIDAEPTGVVHLKVMVELEFRPVSEEDRLRIRIEGIIDGTVSANENTHHLKYYLEEHTCPVNYLGVNELMYFNGKSRTWDHDPHGLFKARWWSIGKARHSGEYAKIERAAGSKVFRFPRD